MTTATLSLAELTGNYAVDPAHSRIGFVARHAMVTKVRGAFNEYDAKGFLDGSDVSKTNVEVTVQAASIDTRNEQRDGHLKSNDFLAMEEFPTITFVSTAATQKSENEFDLTGDLTVRGVTRTITIPFEFHGAATDPFGNQRVGFEGAAEISRKDFGITWNAALETGGVLVSDKIVLEFEISAIKQA